MQRKTGIGALLAALLGGSVLSPVWADDTPSFITQTQNEIIDNQYIVTLAPDIIQRLGVTDLTTAIRTLLATVGETLPAPRSGQTSSGWLRSRGRGATVAIRLPDGSGEPPPTPLYSDALQHRLVARHRVEAPVVPWPAVPHRVLRISAQLYNRLEQYERLGVAVREELAAERGHAR